MMKIIGLTGGIGTGKSTASQIIGSFGVKVIDADQISRALLAPGSPYIKEVASKLGDWILDDQGNVKRKALGKRIFESVELRKQLEKLLHPLIRKEMEDAVEDARKSGEKIVVLDIPLLYENGYWENHVDEVWLIDSTESLQKERVIKRDQLSESEVEARICAQMPLSEKRKRADRLICNSGSREDLESKLHELLASIGSEK